MRLLNWLNKCMDRAYNIDSAIKSISKVMEDVARVLEYQTLLAEEHQATAKEYLDRAAAAVEEKRKAQTIRANLQKLLGE